MYTKIPNLKLRWIGCNCTGLFWEKQLRTVVFNNIPGTRKQMCVVVPFLNNAKRGRKFTITQRCISLHSRQGLCIVCCFTITIRYIYFDNGPLPHTIKKRTFPAVVLIKNNTTTIMQYKSINAADY